MVPSHSVDTTVEVSGTVVCQIYGSLGDLPDPDEARSDDILARNGLADPDPEKWYPLVDLLDALDAIGTAVGDEAVTHLGAEVPRGAEWPPSIETANEGFETVDEAYQLNHRGGDIGYYEFTKVADRERKVTCANPYPCAFDRGIIEGTLRTFGREFSYAPMIFLHETSEQCRAEGGEKCTYRVSW